MSSYPLRLVFGLAMVVTIVLGFLATRRRDFARHRAWMIRSYAIGLVAGTQVFTLGIGGAIFGTGDYHRPPAGGGVGDQPGGRRASDPHTAPPSYARELDPAGNAVTDPECAWSTRVSRCASPRTPERDARLS